MINIKYVDKNFELKLNEANKNFKIVSKSGMKKFHQTPSWLLFASQEFLRECKDLDNRKYIYYKRGSIVRIDFGTNIGGEFSGIHFAVVMNKNDNNHSPVLTVIPLTSKKGKHRIELGKELLKQSIDSLRNSIDQLQEKAEMISNINDELIKLQNDSQTKFNTLKQNAENQGFFDRNLQNLIFEINSMNLTIKEKINLVIEEGSKVNSDLEKLHRVLNIYSKYNKNSYARVENIQTVSKKRIRRINKFDPSGKIILSDLVMEKISNELMKKFISKTT